MKARTEAVLADPTIPWNGVWQDYHWLKEGKNLEPNPGLFITPDYPECFEPEMIERQDAKYDPANYTEKILGESTKDNNHGFNLDELERILGSVDTLAWFDIEVAKKVTPTKELYAKLTQENLDRNLDRISRERDSLEAAPGSSLDRPLTTQAAAGLEPA